MTTVLVGITQPPSAEWPVHWSLPVGSKSEPFLQQRREAFFSAGTATISVCALFYIADRRDLRRAKRVKLRGIRSHFTTLPPFEGAQFDGASCLSEDMDDLQTTVRQQRNFIALFLLGESSESLCHHLFFNHACEDSKLAQITIHKLAWRCLCRFCGTMSLPIAKGSVKT